MAKRGWRPRSTSTTRRPRFSSASAVSDPAKPEPTIATSASTRVTGASVMRARGAPQAEQAAERQHALFEVHRVEAIAPRREAVRAVREPLQIPEVDEDPAAAAGACASAKRQAALDVVERRGAEGAGRGQRLHRAVARTRRHQRDDRRAAGEGGVDRAQQPRVLIGRGHERRRDQQEHAQRDAAIGERAAACVGSRRA